jgi:hypothetical protein
MKQRQFTFCHEVADEGFRAAATAIEGISCLSAAEMKTIVPINSQNKNRKKCLNSPCNGMDGMGAKACETRHFRTRQTRKRFQNRQKFQTKTRKHSQKR